jgi:hypothetical protein
MCATIATNHLTLLRCIPSFIQKIRVPSTIAAIRATLNGRTTGIGDPNKQKTNKKQTKNKQKNK